MQYLFLLYSDETKNPEPPTDPVAFAEWMAPWAAYNAALVAAGVMRGGNALMPTGSATTLSRAAGAVVTTDGPFAETAEQLGGYYLVECDSLDEALKWAQRCPMIHYGKVEVRPIMPTDPPG